jgi:hypothetical protein
VNPKTETVDTSKIKVGDNVRVGGVVRAITPQGFAISLSPSSGLEVLEFAPIEILEHQPRQLREGDRVRFATNPESNQGTVVAVRHGTAWVEWHGSRDLYETLEKTEMLERVS